MNISKMGSIVEERNLPSTNPPTTPKKTQLPPHTNPSTPTCLEATQMAEFAVEEILLKIVDAVTTPPETQPNPQKPNPKPKYPTQPQSSLVQEFLDETDNTSPHFNIKYKTPHPSLLSCTHQPPTQDGREVGKTYPNTHLNPPKYAKRWREFCKLDGTYKLTECIDYGIIRSTKKRPGRGRRKICKQISNHTPPHKHENAEISVR